MSVQLFTFISLVGSFLVGAPVRPHMSPMPKSGPDPVNQMHPLIPAPCNATPSEVQFGTNVLYYTEEYFALLPDDTDYK